jgi:hypothetical protein
MTLSIRGDNHDVVRSRTDDIHVPIIVTGSCTYHTVFIKDTNSVAVSSGEGINICITMIDIESMEVMTTRHGMCVDVTVVKFVTK